MCRGWRNRPGRRSKHSGEDRHNHHGDHAGLALENDHGKNRSDCTHTDCHHQRQGLQ